MDSEKWDFDDFDPVRQEGQHSAMALRSAFEQSLGDLGANALERVFAMAVQQLQAAPRSHRHPWHIGAVATTNGSAASVRSVVLRATSTDPLALRFHTDARSPKVEELREHASLEWLFYEPSSKIQLRVACTAEVLQSGDQWETAWAKTTLPSRRCYLAPSAPGERKESPNVNLPEHLADKDPSEAESEIGKANFAIVQCAVERIDWLYLRHNGHLRAMFTRHDDDWEMDWSTP
ncbi:MAG: pyridoxamine 5'-phosphate oxidase family protein [Aureliella sp.]